jgi:membrane-associated phospholipid phosphatase
VKDVVTSRVRRLTRAIVYAILVTVVVGTIAFLVRVNFDPLTRADVDAIDAATDFTRAHDTFRQAALAWQGLSQPWVLYLLAALLCAWTWRVHTYTSRALWAMATMAIGWALSAVIKDVVQRARPEVSEPIHISSGYSFPSGHTTNGTIAITAAIVLVWPLLSTRWRPVAVVLGTLLVTITCLDRVFVGAHFPSDVIAGVLLGFGLVTASYAGYQGWSPPLASSSPGPKGSTTTDRGLR